MKDDFKEIYLLYDSHFFDWLINQICNNCYALYNRTSVDKNVKRIPMLYKMVEEYAKKNNIEPIKIMNYSIYYINYNGFTFSIFEHISDTSFEYGCYTSSLNKTFVPYYINFDDIKNNDTDYLNNVLFGEIGERIKKLYENGVNQDTIKQVLEGIVNNLENSDKAINR